MTTYKTFMRVARPASTVVYFWHWHTDAMGLQIAEAEECDIIISTHPLPCLASALEEIPIYQDVPRWTLRLVVATATDLLEHLVSYDCAKTMSVHPAQILPIVEWDRGGSVEWLVSDLPPRTKRQIGRALKAAWTRNESDC